MPSLNRATASCCFCELPQHQVQLQNDLAFALLDPYPVSPGHSLVIPKRHVADYWGLSDMERQACHELLVRLREEITNNDHTVTGFNIGLNIGTSAGQTIFHCHYHLIPRWAGDVPNPRGGVRNVIPDKGDYQANRSPEP